MIIPEHSPSRPFSETEANLDRIVVTALFFIIISGLWPPHLSFLSLNYIYYLTPPLPPHQLPSPPSLPSTCAPAEGEFRRRGNPRGSQAPHRWLANYTFITSLLLLSFSSPPLASASQ